MSPRARMRNWTTAALLLLLVVLMLYTNARKYRTCASCGGIREPSSPPRELHHGGTRLPSICWSESCRSDFVKHWQSKDAHPIPEIRHILWRNENVSQYFADQLVTWQKIHPNWTFVLWRDEDMEPFVAAHFPGILPKFKSLPVHIMRVDMIRYMLLYKYGGTYADLDYTLVQSLDQFRRYHAVVTLEPEAHSLEFFGLQWPVKLLANPAFLMAAPGHAFLHFAIQRLQSKAASNGPLYFAGPFGLTEIMESYTRLVPTGADANDVVLVPPSYSFYPYRNNCFNTSGSTYMPKRIHKLKDRCKRLMSSRRTEQQRLQRQRQLRQFCTDVNNMDPITDKSQPVYAIHDMHKSGAIHDGVGAKFYSEKPTDIRGVLKNLKFGREFI